jgi:hypothetical protein
MQCRVKTVVPVPPLYADIDKSRLRREELGEKQLNGKIMNPC